MKRLVFILSGLLFVYFALDTHTFRQMVEPKLDRNPLAVRQASLLTLPGPSERERVPTAALVESPEDGAERALRAAEAYIESHRDDWNLQDHHTLQVDTTFKSPIGTVVKYDLYQGDLKVYGYGAEIRVGMDGETVESANLNYHPFPEADVKQAALSTEELGDSLDGRYEWDSSSPSTAMLFVPPGDNAVPVLAHALTVRKPGSEHPVQGLFRASDGQALHIVEPRFEDFHISVAR